MKEVLGKTERVELLVSGRHEGEDSQVALAPSFIRACAQRASCCHT